MSRPPLADVSALAGQRGHGFIPATMRRHQTSSLGESKDEPLERIDTWGNVPLPCFGVSGVD